MTLFRDRCIDIPDVLISQIRIYADDTTICPSLSSKSDMSHKIKLAAGIETELQSLPVNYKASPKLL